MTDLVPDIIDRIVAENLDVYRASAKRLQEDVSQEAQVASDYHGRLAYELLQNADDAMEGSATKSDHVKFLVTDDALWMANNGRPLSDEDVQGLCGLGASSKVDARGVKRASIGHKGLGFKSVLEITDQPAAFSESISFRLGADIAARHIVNLTQALGRTKPSAFPSMRFPAKVDQAPAEWTRLNEDGFTTGFHFPFKESLDKENQTDLADLLLSMQITTVLFLKHLDRVDIEVDTADRQETRIWEISRELAVEDGWRPAAGLEESGVYRIRLKSSRDNQATFLVAHDADIEIGHHREGLTGPAWSGVQISEVSVATFEPHEDQPSMPSEWKRFHVFLPTEEPCPYPLLINGPFTTDLSRQSVRVTGDANDYNSFLVRKAANLFRKQLLETLRTRGLASVLEVLERDEAVEYGETAHLLHSALAAELGSIPLLPTEADDEVSFREAIFPPSNLEDVGTDYRAALVPGAHWNGRIFPTAEFCRGRWTRIAVDLGAEELEPGESLVALAGLVDPERSKTVDHSSGGFEIDPVLELCTKIYETADADDRESIEEAASMNPLFPMHRSPDRTVTRVAVGVDTAFYPPQSAKHELPLDGLQFMAHAICWGALRKNERSDLLADRMATWGVLFGVKEYNFQEVIEGCCTPWAPTHTHR